MSSSPKTQLEPAPAEDWPVGLDAGRSAEMVQVLCAWFDEHRRDLPWRRNDDPYSIWISEAMLQQTRVETVLDYHRRFLASFPTLRDLAEAPEEQVMALWSGLGYYRRARSLHAAAKLILADHGGLFPRDLKAVLALPGVGPYTAGAVLSIAFQQSEALVDGNVARVFSRLFGLRDEIMSGPVQRLLWRIARYMVPESITIDKAARLPRTSPGNWNQALMELGALVCTPKNPGCQDCPLQVNCVARCEGLTSVLPLKTKQPRMLDVRIEVLVISRGQRVLLVQRPAGGRMAGLWELPTRELGAESHGLWPASFDLGDLGASLELGPELGSLSHSITKHRIKGCLRAGSLPASTRLPKGAPLCWANVSERLGLGLTGLTRKSLASTDLA